MKFLTPYLCLKSIGENGEISGYASVFNVVDEHGDVVVRGAFKSAVTDSIAGKKPKLLWQHDIRSPIGVIEEICEDDYGLFVKGQLLLEVPRAKEVYLLLKNKAIDGFSIGYRIRNNYFKNDRQYLTNIDLLEVSVVTFPACGGAVVDKVKANDDILQKIRMMAQKIKERNQCTEKSKKLFLN
ncbi:MAG: HK97 family phage prohead protease [Holosporaceae bacterium]|jgi:HK97 family phage prohead protease|nr:HK97 family phage prohead protease [Holosporaceae bacterium]